MYWNFVRHFVFVWEETYTTFMHVGALHGSLVTCDSDISKESKAWFTNVSNIVYLELFNKTQNIGLIIKHYFCLQNSLYLIW